MRPDPDAIPHSHTSRDHGHCCNVAALADAHVVNNVDESVNCGAFCDSRVLIENGSGNVRLCLDLNAVADSDPSSVANEDVPAADSFGLTSFSSNDSTKTDDDIIPQMTRPEDCCVGPTVGD